MISNKYLRNLLSEEETIVDIISLSKIYLLNKSSYYFILLLTILIPLSILVSFLTSLNIFTNFVYSLILSFVIPSLKAYIEYRKYKFILTNKRIIEKQGILNITIQSTPYNQISHIELHQGITDRYIYKTGTLVIHHAGRYKKEIILENIEKPLRIKDKINKLIYENKRKRQVQRLHPIETPTVSSHTKPPTR